MADETVGPAQPDALDTLERVVRGLGEELAFFRRRALEAERRLRDVLGQQTGSSAFPTVASRAAEVDLARLNALMAENAELRARIAEAAERARDVASRIRFARQQDDAEAAGASG